jgi:hypothetical protein
MGCALAQRRWSVYLGRLKDNPRSSVGLITALGGLVTTELVLEIVNRLVKYRSILKSSPKNLVLGTRSLYVAKILKEV